MYTDPKLPTGGCSSATPAFVVRVLSASVPRDGRRSRLLLAQAELFLERAPAAQLLGTHQPWRRQYW